MKKHPIDDLFSRKLHNAEITPREEAYQKLQSRMQVKERRIGGWWHQGPWLAAASICLLLGTGWIVWKNYTPENSTTAQVVPEKTSINIPKPEQVAQIPSESTIKSNTSLTKNSDRNKVHAKFQKIVPQSNVIKEVETKIPSQQQVAQITEESAIKNPSLSSGNAESKAIAQSSQPSVNDTKSQPKTVFLQLPSIKETLVASTVNEPIDNTADVQSTAINEDLINKPRKSSRMAKVWQQLKNAKNGERVDWEEVGINSKLLAKASKK